MSKLEFITDTPRTSAPVPLPLWGTEASYGLSLDYSNAVRSLTHAREAYDAAREAFELAQQTVGQCYEALRASFLSDEVVTIERVVPTEAAPRVYHDPKLSRRCQRWSDEDTQELVRMMSRGTGAAMAARKLGRTPKGCEQRYRAVRSLPTYSTVTK